MKEAKFQELVQEIEYFVAGWQMKNPHVIFFNDLQSAFPDVKKKHLKRAAEEVIDL